MKIFFVYVLLCTVRMTMPGLETKTRNKIFLIRVGVSVIGYLVGLAFISLCYHGILRRDQDFALDTSLGIFCFVALIGEYISRRVLRKSEIFPKHKHIPWTF